jgi:hypothetical protein
MNKEIMKQEATYDWLKDEVHCLYERNSELKQRIDKAIEYIESNSAFLEDDEYELFNKKELLDILKGSDSNGKI